MPNEQKKLKRQEWLNNLIDEKLEEATKEIQNDNHNIAMKMLQAGDKCPNCNMILEYDMFFNRQLTCGCDLINI